MSFLTHRRKAFRAGAAFDGFGNASREFIAANSDSVTVPDSASFPTGAQTWCCWVKFTTVPASIMDLMTHWAGSTSQASCAIIKNSSNKIAFFISQNGSGAKSVSSTTTVTTNIWYHVACVYVPSTSIEIYINGSNETTNTTAIYSTVKDSTADFVFGDRPDQSFFFNGQLADCRIYDADIGAAAIAGLAVGTNYQTNLIGWWFDDTDDATTDHAGTFATGTNNGTTYDADGPAD